MLSLLKWYVLVLIEKSRTHALLDVLHKSFVELNDCQSRKAEARKRRERMRWGEKRGNKGESDLRNNMDENSLDALLHTPFLVFDD